MLVLLSMVLLRFSCQYSAMLLCHVDKVRRALSRHRRSACHWARSWVHHWVCDAWPKWGQTYRPEMCGFWNVESASVHGFWPEIYVRSNMQSRVRHQSASTNDLTGNGSYAVDCWYAKYSVLVNFVEIYLNMTKLYCLNGDNPHPHFSAFRALSSLVCLLMRWGGRIADLETELPQMLKPVSQLR